MHTSLWIVSVLATLSSAAPSIPAGNGINPTTLPIISDYFNLLSKKVTNMVPAADICNLSKATMPTAPNPTALPPPTAGHTLKHVAIGRGTQNYTCSPDDSTAIPVANGAIATLYNVSCIASTSPDLLAMLPSVTLQWDQTTTQSTLFPASLAMSGHHYFSNPTTPTFNLDTTAMSIGFVNAAKNASTPAPADAIKGQGGQGNGAVAWLRLTSKAGTTNNLQEVYRLNTAGGNPPATCAGMPATFEVQYAAEYWFWQS